MTNLHHENVAVFHGVCINQSEFVLVNEYCIKGSLEVCMSALEYVPFSVLIFYYYYYMFNCCKCYKRNLLQTLASRHSIL